MHGIHCYFISSYDHKTIMLIDEEFPKNHHVIVKFKHTDGKHYYFILGPGRDNAKKLTKQTFKMHNE